MNIQAHFNADLLINVMYIVSWSTVCNIDNIMSNGIDFVAKSQILHYSCMIFYSLKHNVNLQNIHEATEKFISQQRQEREAVLQVHFIYVLR